MLAFEGLYYKGFEWRYHTNMANDHCSVNCCTNDKRNESGKDLSFFNFPSNETQRSQWIAAIKRDEGPHFQVSVTCDEPRPGSELSNARVLFVADIENFSI